MQNDPVTLRLKAIRNSTGLSIRAVAHLLGMSSSGYLHYESPSRFKDDYLPMDVAEALARALKPHGADEAAIFALAGLNASSRTPVASAAPAGFDEGDARPWAGPHGNEAAKQLLMRALAPDAGNPGTYQVSRDMLPLGLLKSDIVIIDTRASPQAGSLALGNARAESGEMMTVIGRYFPPMLYTSESLSTGKAYDLNADDVAVYYPIIAATRTY